MSHSSQEVSEADETRRVFLNVPYHPDYEPVFLGIISALICLGRIPVIVAEVPEGPQGRLSRIQDEIRTCRVSIHELSQFKDDLPRLNMPFELGIAWAHQQQNPRGHEIYVFESEKFRLQKTLSDWNGFDPKIHENMPEKAIGVVLDCLGRRSQHLDVGTIRKIYDKLNREMDPIKENEASDSVYSARVFRRIILTLIVLAQDEGILEPLQKKNPSARKKPPSPQQGKPDPFA